MEVTREVEGGSQRRKEIQRGGKRRNLGEKLKETRRNAPLRDASPSFHLSNLKLERPYTKKEMCFLLCSDYSGQVRGARYQF